MPVTLHHGDCRTIIPTLGVTVDAICTDPPYDLVAMTKRFGKGYAAAKSPDHQRFARGFMGQQWDGEGIAFDPETWRIIGSVLRPGGFLLAFGAPRTHHRLACAIEDAGFVIQDCLMFMFGTGFPKRRDMLKPAYEPIVLAYKPGAKRTLQVDECRIGTENTIRHNNVSMGSSGNHIYGQAGSCIAGSDAGRWPANVCHDGSDEVVACFDQFGERQSGDASVINSNGYNGLQGGKAFAQAPTSKSYRGANSGSAARFFFSAKAGSGDRWGSRHPTVKPVELLKWLVPLVTPPGGLVLDPFAGSGTTAVAALATGRDCILIEREDQYIADIKERLAFYDGGGMHSAAAKNRNRKRDEGPLFDRPFDEHADALGSYNDAITAIGEHVKAGAPIPDCLLSSRETS